LREAATVFKPIAGIATIDNVPTEGYSTVLEDFVVLYPTQSLPVRKAPFA